MKDYIRVNQLAYDELCYEYDQRAEEKSAFEESVASLGSAVLKHFKQPIENLPLLEIGPGSGEMLLYFEHNACRTIAIELSRKIAYIAQRRSPCSTILVGDVSEFEFLNNSFAIIYAGALIHLFPYRDAVEILSKFYHWLKPEGIFFVNTTIHAISEEGYFEKSDYGKSVKRYRKLWTEAELVDTLVKTGFEIVERRFTDEQNRQKQWVAFLCSKNRI